MSELEKYFIPYRQIIIGIDSEIEIPYGSKKLIYADWIASGRCSCAGTCGHFLLHVDFKHSKKTTDKIDKDDLSLKPSSQQ
jgi:hypothetical protein